MLLVDTNVILDFVQKDSGWLPWSLDQLRRQSMVHDLLVNPVIYAELATVYSSALAATRPRPPGRKV